jgi:hypothetical protein
MRQEQTAWERAQEALLAHRPTGGFQRKSTRDFGSKKRPRPSLAGESSHHRVQLDQRVQSMRITGKAGVGSTP